MGLVACKKGDDSACAFMDNGIVNGCCANVFLDGYGSGNSFSVSGYFCYPR